MRQRYFAMPETTLETLAASIRQKLDARTLRVVGDPSMKVSKVGLAPGFGGFDTNRRLLQREDVQVEVIGEAHEWGGSWKHAADATTANSAGKALIVIGHIPSEQAGMDECARVAEDVRDGSAGGVRCRRSRRSDSGSKRCTRDDCASRRWLRRRR